MIKEMKLFGHKGITELKLSGLERINVICGKNNSGKSSVLESIVQKKNHTLGRTIEEVDIKWLIDTFEMVANSYSTPHPDLLKKWFKEFIPTKVNFTIYENPIEELTLEWSENFNKYCNRKYGKLNFQKLFKDFLDASNIPFNPLLIPPKRRLDHEIQIDTSASPSPEGAQLLNRLFFLKNQDPHSKEYKIYDEIYKSFEKITNGYYFNIVPEKANKIAVFFTNNLNNWIRGNDCGLGLRDVLVILSFIIDFDFNFIMIEEPENHIHPEMQRRLLEFLQTLENKQFLMATHSNVFLDSTYVNKMYFVERTDTVRIFDETNRATVLRDLGYSIVDNLVSDLVILVEGPTDAPFVEEICKKIGFWNSYNIKFWPLGGDIMSQLDLSTFVDNVDRNKIIALIDSDKESQKERNRFKKNCKKMGIECIQLERYAIENYIPIDVVRNFSEFKVPDDVMGIKPNEKVENQIGINLKKNLRKLAKAMDLKDIGSTDLFRFCKKIEGLVKE